jgi:predicted metal-binding membrane protein
MTETASSALEALLRRDRKVVVGALLAVIALCWLWVALGVGMEMSAVEMTRMSRDMVMTPAVWTPAYAALMFAMWWVMMVAMMLPSAAPILLIFARISRREREAKRPWVPTGIFATGYLAVWAGFSAVATALQWGLEGSGLLSAMMVTTTASLGAALLVAAGLWQIAPIKQACLRQCRSPVAFLTNHWRDGSGGAFRMGLVHGAYCVGCCWFLMTLLFFGGVMNLWWIGGLAAYVLMEKVLPMGHWLGYAVGVGLVAWAFGWCWWLKRMPSLRCRPESRGVTSALKRSTSRPLQGTSLKVALACLSGQTASKRVKFSVSNTAGPARAIRGVALPDHDHWTARACECAQS